ncbi:hypothetical protein F6Y02_02135 [Bacillus megaterium]|nr:hypothetical protein [Priestia megaterium]
MLTRRAKHKNKSITYSQEISLDHPVIINLNDLKHLKGNSVSVEEIIDVAIKAEEQLYELSLADFNVIKIKYMNEKYGELIGSNRIAQIKNSCHLH